MQNNYRNNYTKLFLAIVFNTLALCVSAQSTCIDTGFQTGKGFNLGVHRIVLQQGNKILIAGEFTSYNGTKRKNILRLHNDGTLDTSFNSNHVFKFGSGVFAIALQPDGKILIAVTSTTFSYKIINLVVRLNVDGTLDGSFNSFQHFSNSVYAIAVQEDGKIIAGGDFRWAKKVKSNRIVRLQCDSESQAPLKDIKKF